MSIKDYFFYHKKKFITVVLFVVILVGGFFLYKVYAKELNYSKEIEKKTEKTVLKTDKKGNMQDQLFESIEEDLNELMVVLSEEEYVAFVENDKYMKLYDIIIDMNNKKMY